MKKIKWWRIFAIVTFPIWAFPAFLGVILFFMLYAIVMAGRDLYYWVIDEPVPSDNLHDSREDEFEDDYP